ncbi:hypothetical protein [Pseudofrankia asymbiotica]|uniref:hypothetical protein n=1 Tax=Pseudofrankia asymbiotica TaxID=1834516 RepID=UPI0010541FE8|nr:hypothetical protein [Pseudofrankia asymbiotica]
MKAAAGRRIERIERVVAAGHMRGRSVRLGELLQERAAIVGTPPSLAQHGAPASTLQIDTEVDIELEASHGQAWKGRVFRLGIGHPTARDFTAAPDRLATARTG